MDGKVRKPQFELDSEQVRYEHRFAPFNSVVTPPPVHYIQFKVVHSVLSGIRQWHWLNIEAVLFCVMGNEEKLFQVYSPSMTEMR